MNISVVVPCYRSAETIRPLVEGLAEALPAVADRYEVVLVVDGSPDDTASVAEGLVGEFDFLRVLVLRRNYGQHNALLAGLQVAAYDVTVTMDDDLQHLPSQIAALVAPLAEPGTDLVYGVPETEEHGALRSLSSRSVKAALAASGVPNARYVSAFRAFRTVLRDSFVAVRDPNVNLDVLLSWATDDVVVVRVAMARRQEGRSNYSFRRLVRHSFNMITGYSEAPLRLVTYLGFACALLGLALLVLVIVGWLTGRTTVAGFTTVASMVALFSGAQMLAIGVLGEYLGRLHFRSMGRPTYVVGKDLRGGSAEPQSD